VCVSGQSRDAGMFPVLFIVSRIAMVSAAFAEGTDALSFLLFIVSGGFLEITIWHMFRTRLRAKFLNPAWAPAADTLMNLFYAIACMTDVRVFTAFRRPLDLMLVREAVGAMPLTTMLSLVSATDIVFLSLALLTPLSGRLGVAQLFSTERLPRAFYLTTAALLTVALFFGRWAPQIAAPGVRVPLLVAMNELQGPSGLGAAVMKKNSEGTLTDEPAVTPGNGSNSGQATKTNVILIVLESTGSRYIFDEKLTRKGQGVPMPFLHALSQRSLYLSRHYATANSSPRALFSIFTGLYPEPEPEFFSLRPSLKIKTWTSYLPSALQFLVTPCAVEWYFPLGLLKNNGITEIFGQSQLDFAEKRTHPAEARNEEQTADYFAARIAEAPQPFFATYISFAPHYPYHDYGDRWHVSAGETRLDRYVDNLRLLDAQIEKIFKALEARAVLQNTLIVIVGDHSEAFRQHKGNYIHSLHSYEENLAVPALFYYPAAIKPRRIDFLTSHVDIAPTVLDLLKVRYAAQSFQGVSLLRPVARNHILAYGNEETITAYSGDRSKTQLLRTGICREFDLLTDPAEQLRRDCVPESAGLRAAMNYRDTQVSYLNALQQKAARMP